LIELAYRVAEACGLPLWCQDEAGPYATTRVVMTARSEQGSITIIEMKVAG
jgi:hypothetical protein